MIDPKYQMRFEKKVRAGAPNECWPWSGAIHTKGYGLFKWRVDGRQERLAHRFAYAFAFGVPPAGMCVLHKCDNPRCCNPAHLFLGNNRDNVADMVAKGRQNARRGSSHPVARLTEKDVIEIRSLYASDTMGYRLLAKHFDVSRSTIRGIIKGSWWRHLLSKQPLDKMAGGTPNTHGTARNEPSGNATAGER